MKRTLLGSFLFLAFVSSGASAAGEGGGGIEATHVEVMTTAATNGTTTNHPAVTGGGTAVTGGGTAVTGGGTAVTGGGTTVTGGGTAVTGGGTAVTGGGTVVTGGGTAVTGGGTVVTGGGTAVTGGGTAVTGGGTAVTGGGTTVPTGTGEVHAPVPTPDFAAEQRKKYKADAELENTRTQNEQTFEAIDKKPIKSVLWRVMEIIESDRDGVSKMRTAAIHLQALLKIHKDLKLGSPEKLEALRKLKTEVKEDLVFLAGKNKIKYSSEADELAAVNHELASLVRDKFDKKITDLLRDYYVDEVGMISSWGGGASCVVGFDVRVGKVVSATGKRYPTGCVTGSVGLQVGLHGGHMGGREKGKSKTTGDVISFASEKPPLQMDVFLAGKSKSVSTSGNDDIQVKDYVVGLRAGSIGWTKPFKLFSAGRDYKYLRQRLGLVANPVQ